MKRFLTIAAAAVLWAAPAWAQLAPGTVKLLSKNGNLIDGTSGDAFVEIRDDASAKFLVVGPETLQADVRVNLSPAEATGAPAVLAILSGGKEVARFKLTPKSSSENWKARPDIKPAQSVGFYMEIEAGPHAYEFKVIGAPKHAGLLLVAKTKAKRPLPAGAPVVTGKPVVVATPTPAPTATPAVVVVGTPRPTPTPIVVNTPIPIEQLHGDGTKASDLHQKRRTYETMFKVGFVTPSHQEFSGTAAIGAEARQGFGGRKTVAVGLEVLNESYSALVPDDPNRNEVPAAADITLLPISVNGIWQVPLETKIQPYLGAGATLCYGQSVLRQLDRDSVPESVLGFGAQVVGGLEYDISGTDLAEGGHRLFLEAKGSYLNVPFEAHDFTDWSSVQVLGGISLKF